MTLAQLPNASLLVAIAGFVISYIPNAFAHRFGLTLTFVALIIWSYQEIMTGVNWFRKLLGMIVLLYTAIMLFTKISL